MKAQTSGQRDPKQSGTGGKTERKPDWWNRGNNNYATPEQMDRVLDDKARGITDTSTNGVRSNGTATSGKPAKPARWLKSTRMSDVQSERVKHLWPYRTRLSKMGIMAGEQGQGKSMVMLDKAARISTGTPWPDTPDIPNPVGSVILLSAEDGLGDTIRPRLEAAGADLSKIVAIEGVEQAGRKGVDQIDIAADVHRLHELIEDIGDVRLVVIDPITAYLGSDCDIHRDNVVRAVLGPLTELAARHDVAVQCVMHLRKSGSDSAVFRVLGSVAFTALARSVWMVGRPPDSEDPDARILVCGKMNLCRPAKAINFSIVEPGRVEWGELSDLTANEVFSATGTGHPDETGPAVADAMDFLREVLAEGAAKSKDILKEAKQNGIAERTLARAKGRLGVTSEREGFGGTWYWRLPDDAPSETTATVDGIPI